MPIRWMGAVGVTPDWQVLAEVEVASDCDYVDFTGLDINRDWEYYLDVTVKNPTGSNSHCHLFVEGDYTATNYYNQYLTSNGTTITADRENRPSIGWLPAGWKGLLNVRITRDPDGYFRYNAVISRGTGSGQRAQFRAGSKTAPISNITSLRVSAQVSGAIGAGSRFILARPRS